MRNKLLMMLEKKAMETLSETKKRKESEGKDSKPKRARSTGNDTLTYLREKAAQDKELKQKELDAQIQNQQIQQQMQQQMLQLLASQQQQMLALLPLCFFIMFLCSDSMYVIDFLKEFLYFIKC